MSRLFPETVFVELAPSQLVIARRPYGRRGRPRERSVLACEPASGSEPWRGAVAALHAMPLPACRLSVELSAHLVRYALLPWSEALETAREEEAYVRHHFASIYGERAKGWAVRASDAASGAPRLASAVDRALIEEIKAAVKGRRGVRLVSIQPQLMSRFNAWRAAVPTQGAWVVLAEPDRACIALHGRDGWRSVQNAKGGWLTALDRERFRTDGDAPHLVLLGGAKAPTDAGPWNFREMAA